MLLWIAPACTDVATAARNKFCEHAVRNHKKTKERISYEHENHGHQRNRHDGSIEMDAASIGDVAAPRRRPRRGRLWSPTLNHPARDITRVTAPRPAVRGAWKCSQQR